MDEKPQLDYRPPQPDTVRRDVERALGLGLGSIACVLGVIPLLIAIYATNSIIFHQHGRYFREELLYTILWWVLTITVEYLGVRFIRYGIKLGREGATIERR